jgi:hypothetical protein
MRFQRCSSVFGSIGVIVIVSDVSSIILEIERYDFRGVFGIDSLRLIF